MAQQPNRPTGALDERELAAFLTWLFTQTDNRQLLEQWRALSRTKLPPTPDSPPPKE